MRVATLIAIASLAAGAAGHAQVVHQHEIPVVKASPDSFTGDVSVRILAKPQPPAQASVGSVTFTPGARSHWHTHPAGQTLIVTDGCGWTQEAGGPVRRICKGDTVTVAPGVRHWHGATANGAMTHLAITETVDGRNVDWKEPVSAAEYQAAARTVR
jgi:quercetin dioxygenase-like cupin family protein